MVFVETRSVKYLDLPNGSYNPDHPNFSISNPATWTGNMAQYVRHNYFYIISFDIYNSGGNTAYDVELDLYTIFDNSDEDMETIKIGKIPPGENIHRRRSIMVQDKQLIECDGAVYWYD